MADDKKKVIRFPMDGTEIRDSGALRAKSDAFDAKINAGEATEVDLMWYVLTIDNVGYEVIPSSMGMDWIRGNPDEFGKLVGNVDEFILRIMELAEFDLTDPSKGLPKKEWDGRHSLCYKLLRGFLISKDLMKLLSSEMRERFVLDVYPRVGTINNSWITAALLAGVSRECIALALLERLERVEIKEGYADDVDGFLRHGGGGGHLTMALRSMQVPEHEIARLRGLGSLDALPMFTAIEAQIRLGVEPTSKKIGEGMYSSWLYYFPEINPWEVLSNQELYQALLICVSKAPGETLNVLDHKELKPRLSLEMVDKIVCAATRNMRSIEGVSIDKLERLLTLSGREMLARGLNPVNVTKRYLHKPTAQFLFRIVFELPPTQRAKFWMDVVNFILRDVNSTTAYCAWCQLKLEDDEVEITLRNWLYKDGYLVEPIVKWNDEKRGTQMVVVMNPYNRFVQERNSHRYYPQVGDLVIFKPDAGRQLTPYVRAVAFIPVMKDLD